MSKSMRIRTIRQLGYAATTLLLTSVLALAAVAEDAVAENAVAENAVAEEERPAAVLDPLVDELITTLDAAIAESKAAEMQATAIRQRTRDAARATMLDVRKIAVEYRKRVQLSHSIDETEPFFESIRDGIAAARTTARDAVPNPKVDVQLQNLDEILGELGAHYRKAH